MNGIHEVAGSIPAWSTNLRSPVIGWRLPTVARRAKVGLSPVHRESYGWQATRRLSTVAA